MIVYAGAGEVHDVSNGAREARSASEQMEIDIPFSFVQPDHYEEVVELSGASNHALILAVFWRFSSIWCCRERLTALIFCRMKLTTVFVSVYGVFGVA